MSVYYNEINPFCVDWLNALISAGVLAEGLVDNRPIQQVRPEDLVGFTQHHFFAGLGGWPYAARLAGWPDDRRLWTGSCPCQPWSGANPRARGELDDRHLWPFFRSHIEAHRPPCVMGEQVADAVGKGWLDRVWTDMEDIQYAFRPVVLSSCSVDAPQDGERIYFVAEADAQRLAIPQQRREPAAEECWITARAATPERSVPRFPGWGHRFARGADGLFRRVKPGLRLLAHGIPGRVGGIAAYGNAVNPSLAAQVIAAYMEIGVPA